ncbi:hypothetical protein LWF01_13325 [Saxibacter everestensis]|uniref:Nudix hydrolase domain-containing protein n=1 Tax=Saxibacter everestensis TaxID=2909229 RepID=A0ABY8QSD5_9MICO|nr:hypothetical protein LWF01_13325 [Brevibacteriaceae bacterium ZFBP1038]
MHLVTRQFPVADDLRRQLEAWGSVEELPDPVTPRLAATVMLLRDSADGVEVFLLKRAMSMSFAPERYAFPGGRVDPSDTEEVPWGGWTPDRCKQRLGISDPALARQIVVSAVRETFEECGVLLASTSDGELVGEVSGGNWQAFREKIVHRELTFGDFLRHSEFSLRADLLHPWARWITPGCEHRRYDTVFFVAAVPPGQEAKVGSSEATWGGWLSAKEAVERGRNSGGNEMLPPTLVSLEELAAVPTVAAAMSQVRNLKPIQPTVRQVDGDWLIEADISSPPLQRERHTVVVPGVRHD